MLAQLDWRPSLSELDELSENQIQYVILCKEVLLVARNGGNLAL